MDRIDGAQLKELKMHPDERGRVMEILRRDDDLFESFGQVYITTAYPGVVKAWHLHRIQTDHFCVVKGMMKVALFDGREGSPTQGLVNVFYMGEHRPLLLRIPPGVYHGFQCVGAEEAIVVNCPTEPYNADAPDEVRLHPHDNHIPFDWRIQDG